MKITVSKFLTLCSLLLALSFSAKSQTWEIYDSLRLAFLQERQYDSVLVYAQKSLQSAIDLVGENDTLYPNRLKTLMFANFYLGNYYNAIDYAIKEQDSRRILQGDKNPEYISTLNNLAYLYGMVGKYEAALDLFREVVSTRRYIFGEKHPEYAAALNNLADMYRSLGNFPAAEALFNETLQIRQELFGENNPDYANTLNNLAVLYYTVGNYDTAISLFKKVAEIQEATIGENNPRYAQTVNNLAAAYFITKQYEDAELLYKKAIILYEEIRGTQNPAYAQAISNLAYLYMETNSFEKADSLMKEAYNIRKEILGDNHPVLSISYNNFGLLYEAMGKYDEAEKMYQKSLDIRKNVFGVNDYEYARALINMGGFLHTQERLQEAEPLFIEGINTINSAIYQNFTFMSENEKEKYFETLKNSFDKFYLFALKRKNDNIEITSNAYNNIIQNKGILLKSSTAMRLAILESNDSLLVSQYMEWIELKKEITNLYSMEISRRHADPNELEQKANIIERELARKSSVFSDFEKQRNITWQDIRNNLQTNEAAIEFINFPSGNAEKRDLYCALIITKSSEFPEMIELFFESEIDSLYQNMSANDFNNVIYLYGTNEETKTHLYNLIWKPIEKYLENINTIFVSPSGILNKVSFASIAKDKNVYLCDLYDINIQSNTANVVIESHKNILDKEFSTLMFGGIEYNLDDEGDEIWPYLEGSMQEVKSIKDILQSEVYDVNLYSGKYSTEERFKEIAGLYDIVHVATHGFFYPDPRIVDYAAEEDVVKGEVLFRAGKRGFGVMSFMRNQNPLMRSGLTFAGANRVWSEVYSDTDDDGVLTAAEVITLDMRNTQLVVLSACETGLGDIRGSEGVYGLQRAFKMAGVDNIIMSLWQVPDKETVEFMELFYTKLLDYRDVRTAFNETQREMRQKYDPFYWAAFVLVK